MRRNTTGNYCGGFYLVLVLVVVGRIILAQIIPLYRVLTMIIRKYVRNNTLYKGASELALLAVTQVE